MTRVLQILVREYLENVRTKAFLFGVFLTPVLMGLTFLIPMLAPKAPQRAIAVADFTGVLGDAFEKEIASKQLFEPDAEPKPRYRVEHVDVGTGDAAARAARFEEARAALESRVKEGKLYGFVALHTAALSKEKDVAAAEFCTGSGLDPSVHNDVREVLDEIVNARVVEQRSIPKDAAGILSRRARIESTNPLAKGEGGTTAAALAPLIFAFLLFFSIVGISQALITSTLEEKGNRVIEVLLSSVSPLELMAGKILGICLVGLTLVSIWAIGGGTALVLQGLGSLVDAGQIGLFLVYYALGFFLIASLMVAVGSACNTLKEAQNLLAPVMVLLSLPLMLWIVIMREPNGTLATVLSFVPPFTPFLMMMRVASLPPPPAWQVPVSIMTLAFATYLAVRFAARVFRVGILLYGKPPSLRELFRWMRA